MSITTILFILFFFVGLILALIVNGAWAFLVYQIVYFVNPAERWWSNSIPDISYSFISVMFLALAYLTQYKSIANVSDIRSQPTTKWMAGVLLCYVFVYFFALDPDAHWEQTIWLLKLYIVLYLAFKLLNDDRKLKWAIWAYIAGTTYIGYVAYGLGRNRGVRLEGIGTVDSPDSNGIAAAIAPALVLLIYFAWRGNSHIKAIAVVSAALVVNAIVLINSRGAFLGAAAGAGLFICYMLFSQHQRGRQRPIAILIIVVGIFGSYSLTDAAFWERMATLQEVDDGQTSGSHRVEFWLATFDMVQDYPTGLGIRGYNVVSKRYLNPEKYGDKNKSVHSTWFQVLSEIGWHGLVVFIGMLVACFRMSRKTKLYLIQMNKIDDYFFVVALEAALVTFLVAGTFINRGRAEILYWLLLFVVCASNVYYVQKVGAPEKAQQKRH